MKSYLLILIVALVNVETLKSVKEEWADFKVKYSKEYKSVEEEIRRFNNFLETYEVVRSNNHAENNTLLLELNHFSDLSLDELPLGLDLSAAESFLGYTVPYERGYATLPDSMDWREKGIITPVKDQSLNQTVQCGSCWAFAIVAALESHYLKKYQKEVLLSEQYLVDCEEHNHKCATGSEVGGMLLVKKHGIPTEKLYPYVGRNETCRNVKRSIKIKTYRRLRSYDEEEMKEVVFAIGPITAPVFASHEFKTYTSGVLKKFCQNRPNHVILIVGYGTDPVDGDYWIGKNSWGERWGEKGFFKIPRNRNNFCGIASLSLYPVL